MTDRERLIELLVNFNPYKDPIRQMADRMIIEKIADYLLANGVIVPPCKVGDIVYTIFEGDIEALKVIYAKTEESAEFVYRYYDAKNGFLSMPFTNKSIGKTVFLTKEEAERELEKRGVSSDR